MSDYKPCPICDSPDTRFEPEGDEGGTLAYCTNLECASNGGTNASALLKRIMRTKVKHEPLFDLAVETHDDAVKLHEAFVKELDTLESMTDDHEQQALFVEASLRTVRKETLKLMDLTREDS